MNELTNWMHCNNCGMRFQSNVKWFATSCGHILCEMCTKKMQESKCAVCQRVSQVIEINETIDVNMQQFFSPFESFLKKTLETVVKVYSFQLGHRNRLFQMLSQKYAHVKKELINNLNKNKNLAKENKMMRDLMMANQGRSFSTSTPATVVNNMHPGNFSDISSIPPSVSAKKTAPGFAMRMHHPINFTPNQMYPSSVMYHRPSPNQPHMSQFSSSARRVPIHRPMSGATDSMRNLNFGKRT